MNKRFSWIFLLVSGAFFVFVVGLTGYRIENTRRQNAAAAHEQVSLLAAQAVSLQNTTGGFDTPAFRKAMREVFDGDPRLLLLSIHSPQDGIVYLVSRSRAYLKEPSSLDPSWRGKPAYTVSRGYEVLLSRPLSEGGGPVMDALFVVMGREDFYPVVRDDLFLFLAFLLVCGVIVLIVTNVQQDGEPHARPRSSSPAARPASPARPLDDAAAPAPAAPAEGTSRALTSPRTGLVWADHLEARLRAELSRAAAADLEIALAKVRIDEPYIDAKLPMVHAGIAAKLKESFPLHDLIFETGSDSCTLVMPDSDVDAAVRALDTFRKGIAATPIEGRNRTVSVGASSRGGRLIEASTLLEEAAVSLAKASREGGNQVIGFRADPSRFRDTLTGSRV
jgi:GGDEF domain-containing protein